MKEVITILLTCLLSLPLYSQNYNFSLGVTYQPFYYKSYNKADWDTKNEPNGANPNNPDKFNGYSIGMTFTKPINDYLKLKGEILYSNQTQYYKFLSSSYNSTPIYNRKMTSNFKIVRLPVMIRAYKEIGYQTNFFVSIYLGGQLSYLTYYKKMYRSYDVDHSNNSFSISNELKVERILTPQLYQEKFRFNPTDSYEINKRETPFIFTEFPMGLVGGLELQKVIASNFIIGLGIRYDYDITNSEKHIFAAGHLEQINRPKTHHIRFGLTFSAAYVFL